MSIARVAHERLRQVCPLAHEALLDCNHDDYFHTAPPAENYLATHWNVADSSFLVEALVDTTPPTLSPPTVRFGSSAGKTAVPLEVRWSGTDASGIASYTLLESVDGGAYAAVPLAADTATSAVRLALPGPTYRYRVDALDDFGTAASAEGAETTLEVRQETSAAIDYGKRWQRSHWPAALGDHQRRSSTAGASARFSFTGSAVAWVARKSLKSGRARVYVDGTHVKTVDLFSWTTRARRIVYATRWEAPGAHTLKVVVVGTAGRPRVEVDAFLVLR